MTDNVRAVVIDTGSYSCKAGFAGDAAPRVTFPSTVPSDIQTTHTEQQIHPIERA
jgi:actin-like protein 6A